MACVCVILLNVTALFISVAECKSTWARLRSYYRKALRRRKSTSGQAARNVKKWRFEEQMRFLQNHFQERGWVVIKMIHVCKFKKSNSSERIVPDYDKEGKSRYFIRRPTCISGSCRPQIVTYLSEMERNILSPCSESTWIKTRKQCKHSKRR